MKESILEEGWFSSRLRRPGLCALTAFTLMLWSSLTTQEFMGPLQMALLTLSFLMWFLALFGFALRARQAHTCGEIRVFRQMLCLVLCMALALLGEGALARSRLQKGTVADFLDVEYGVREIENIYVHTESVRPEPELTPAQQQALTSALLALPCRTWGPEPVREVFCDFNVYYKANRYDRESPGTYVQETFSWSLHWYGDGLFRISDGHTGKSWIVAVDADWDALLAEYLP